MVCCSWPPLFCCLFLLFPWTFLCQLGFEVNPFLLGPSSTSLLRRSFGWSLLVSAPAWFDCFCCMFITFAFNIGLLFFGRWLVPSCCSRFLHFVLTFPFTFWFWCFTIIPFLITLSKAPDLCSNLQLLSSGHLDLFRENGAEMAGPRHHTFLWRIREVTSSARTSRGWKFPKGKELYSTERICL